MRALRALFVDRLLLALLVAGDAMAGMIMARMVGDVGPPSIADVG